MNIKFIVEYCGTRYHGWQVQPNGLSVQEVLQKVCSQLFGQDVSVIGAGRTDAGVHALGQVAMCSVCTPLEPQSIKRACNFYLPHDIVIRDVSYVPDDFHPRYSAKAKVYQYRIFNRREPSPFYAQTAFFYPHALDSAAMREAAGYFIGEHDFTAFSSNAKRPGENKTRRIFSVDIIRSDVIIDIVVRGESFLYKMVRAMAGALLAVGRGRSPAVWIQDLLALQDRREGPEVLPAHGLTLVSVEY